MKPISNTPHDRMRPSVAGAAVLAALSALMCAPVLAVEKPRFDFQGAAGVCQASNPLHEADLRSRPLGLANTGTETTFLTCAFQGSDPTGQKGAYQVQVNVSNNDTVAKAIECTMVVVYRMVGDTADRTSYVPRGIALPAGGGGFISWVPTDITGALGGPEISKSGISCAMPAKTTLHYMGNYYREEVGS